MVSVLDKKGKVPRAELLTEITKLREEIVGESDRQTNERFSDLNDKEEILKISCLASLDHQHTKTAFFISLVQP